MKIIKKNLVESMLNEADVGVANPKADSTSTIVDKIEDSTNGKMPKKAADIIAADTKAVGKAIEAETVVLPVADKKGYLDGVKFDNRLTKALDASLRASRRARRRGTTGNSNVLVTGMPGSSKTASIKQWARSNGVFVYEINAKNGELDALINGFPSVDPDNPGFVKQLQSSTLNVLDEYDEVILFIDEYNRQVDPSIRGSLLSLINEHEIYSSKDKSNKYRFDSLLFTVAATNPFDPLNDPGAAPLNLAELGRFLRQVQDFDSDQATTLQYINAYTADFISKTIKGKGTPDTWDEQTKEDVEGFLRQRDLGNFVVSHEDFKYDTKADISDLTAQQKALLAQREISDALMDSDGNVDDFDYWLHNESNMLDKNIKDIDGILKEYTVPTYEELLKKYASLLGISAADVAKAANKPETAEDASTEDSDSDEEEDADNALFRGKSAKTSITGDDIRDKIGAAMGNWGNF